MDTPGPKPCFMAFGALAQMMQWHGVDQLISLPESENIMTVALKHAIAWCIVWMAFLLVGPAHAAVIISEILADPETDWNSSGVPNYRDDEWVEVYNNGAIEEDLSHFYLRDITGKEFHLQLDGVLSPGQARVFYGSDAVAWQEANDVTISGLSLNNTGDTVELILWNGTEFQVVDHATYGDHEAEDERSCGPDHETGVWMLFDGLNPYEGSDEPVGTGCFPTPGEPNICTPTVPAQSSTLGGIKSRYR